MPIQSNALCRLCPSIDVKAEVTRRSCGYTNDTVSVPYLVLMKEEGMTLSILAAVSGTILLPEIFVDLFLFMLLIVIYAFWIKTLHVTTVNMINEKTFLIESSKVQYFVGCEYPYRYIRIRILGYLSLLNTCNNAIQTKKYIYRI